MKTLLKLLRVFILAFFALMFAIGVFGAIVGSPVPGLLTAAFGAGLFYIIKSSRFLTLSKDGEEKANEFKEKLSSATREIGEKISSEIQAKVSIENEKKAYLKNIKQRSIKPPLEITVLGGSGWESEEGKKYLLSIDAEAIFVSNVARLSEQVIAISNIIEIDIGGPGKITSNAGVVGGGFGAEGAMHGIAAATVINLLTTHSSTKTIIRIVQKTAELVFITSKIEPEEAKTYFSNVFVNIKNKNRSPANSKMLGSEIEKLYSLKELGAITQEEFEKAKKEIFDH